MAVTNPLEINSVFEKIEAIEASCHGNSINIGEVPNLPGRDVEVRRMSELPSKTGLSKGIGQARLLHDLASIELQAMELGYRSLLEYPEAPREFKAQLASVVLDEARHLTACLKEIKSLGFQWGDWPVHLSLWNAVSSEDTLLERLVIVHRYLEGSGLDAGEKIMRRLDQVGKGKVKTVLQMISDEELGHVQFGSYWYQNFCNKQKISSDRNFKETLEKFYHRLPRRLEKMDLEKRQQAGFSVSELKILEELQKKQSIEKDGDYSPPFLNSK